jgi:photosystem II stability/assembly factor-like uncharacterized protein
MNLVKKSIVYGGGVLIVASCIFYFNAENSRSDSDQVLKVQLPKRTKKTNKSLERRAAFLRARAEYEYNILKSPVTGRIPYRVRERELQFARTIRQRGSTGSGVQSPTNLNNYIPAGPDSLGGRTRVVLFDKRYNGTSNRVLLSGSVSGGIYRSADGGSTWTRVGPDNDFHNLTTLAQDPRAGFEDTWYAGGGEAYANSADAPGAPYLSHGIWKSTDNGLNWTKLSFNIPGIPNGPYLPESFDHPFDFVHRIIVNPVNGHVYVAGHRRLVRSTDGGATWAIVFSGTKVASADNGQMDITATTNGLLYLTVNGGFPDTDKRGVWSSPNGTTWTRLAGGSTINVDSVADWRANDPGTESRRIILALAPSNQNILYVCYENGFDQDGFLPRPEVDLYRLDATSGTQWTNLSANMPDFPEQLGGVDPLETQDGYNMMLAVKPNDPNAVFLGATNLYRSTNGFTNTAGTSWIGGYGNTLPTLTIYGSALGNQDRGRWSHPDMHYLAFDPTNPNRAICANDGGLQFTENIMGTAAGKEPVAWRMVAKYQTVQYYHVAIDPEAGVMDFIGGAQDNGTQFRDGSGVFGTANENVHIRFQGGDGGSVGMIPRSGNTKTIFGSTQLGDIFRITFSGGPSNFDDIRPVSLTPFPGTTDGFGEFVTYFRNDFDNPEDLYYVNFNRLFRTNMASGVSSLTWQEMTGVAAAVNTANPTSGTDIAIRSLETTRGTYGNGHTLFIGTSNGKLFRLEDPRNALVTASPVDISPVGLNGSVSDIAVNPNDDNEIMIVLSNYDTESIWWTNNAKSSTPTWRIAEGNLTLPSVRSCAIVVKEGVTEYYVGTSVGLYSALNIGQGLQSGVQPEWEREGGDVLNYAIINAIDYRPQDNVLLLGTHGNGMYYSELGSPNFNPGNGNGGTDSTNAEFIRQVTPTITGGVVNYRVGNMFSIRRLEVQLMTISGQTVLAKRTGYSNGSVNLTNLPAGVYVLVIRSEDRKHRYVRRVIRR